MTDLSDYLEDALLNHVFMGVPYTAPAAIYLALLTDEGDDATSGTEVTGGGYARVEVDGWVLAPGGAGQVTNANLLTIPDMPECTVVGALLMDDLTGGNVLAHKTLSSPVSYADGANAVIQPGALTFTLN